MKEEKWKVEKISGDDSIDVSLDFGGIMFMEKSLKEVLSDLWEEVDNVKKIINFKLIEWNNFC